ncbi:hypothetical protein CCYA_CCYA07G1987 [Cyanidiococcus yangmingshanensis]|nr:hypothetical protein CCYA_CCYA07G1987 [Cyanidiococcus yangmingshanensis]
MGIMDVNKNPFVEAWAAKRETLEETFRFTPRNIRNALLFGVVVPLGIYVLVGRDVQESNLKDKPQWRHLKRDFLGLPAKPTSTGN